MILYFSGASSKLVTQFMIEQNCSRLFSFYIDKKLIESKICNDVFLDCGAWTAFTQGITINVNEYCDYLKVHKDCYRVAASLDVIPKGDVVKSAEDSYNNFKYLRSKLGREYPIIPTYHRGESLDSLRKLLTYSDEFGDLDYIGIGAIANNVNKNMRTEFLDSVFSVIHKENPNIKVHLFGLTDLSLLNIYPIYSADSTTWVMAGAMGEILTDFGRVKVSNQNFHVKSVNGYSKIKLDKLSSYVQNLGFNLQDLQNSAEYRKMFNIAFMKNKVESMNCVPKNFSMKKRLF